MTYICWGLCLWFSLIKIWNKKIILKNIFILLYRRSHKSCCDFGMFCDSTHFPTPDDNVYCCPTWWWYCWCSFALWVSWWQDFYCGWNSKWEKIGLNSEEVKAIKKEIFWGKNIRHDLKISISSMKNYLTIIKD